MNVNDTASRGKETEMTTFTIDMDNNISAFAAQAEAAAAITTAYELFMTEKELAQRAGAWPAERLVAVYNSLPGAKPVKKFKTVAAGISKIWKSIQGLGEAVQPVAEPVKPKAQKKAKGGAPAAQDAPSKDKASKKATPSKKAPKAKTAPARAEKPTANRGGSKSAQVVAMLQRKHGATLTEIMQKMGWQKHTVRGFMAGAMKKAGYAVESFKPEGGERSYRINS
jgi:hypothetical protein